jgi:hypothetical protein
MESINNEENIKANFFFDLLADWFKGEKTKNEIIDLTKNYINLSKYTEDYSFDYALELALTEYDESCRNAVSFYKSEDIELVTVKGMIHHLTELKSNNITICDFLAWASWCNTGCENTSGDFENLNIEYFCLIFILNYSNSLKSHKVIDNFIEIIKKSNDLSYGKFVVLIYLQIEKERKSFYYFFKLYLENKRSNGDFKNYIKSKYDHNLKCFAYDFDTFPYHQLLDDIHNNNGIVDEFIAHIEEDKKQD